MSNPVQQIEHRSLKERLQLIRYEEFTVALSPQECVGQMLRLKERDNLGVKLLKNKSAQDNTQAVGICVKRVRGTDWSTYVQVSVNSVSGEASETKSNVRLKFVPFNVGLVLVWMLWSVFWIFYMRINLLYAVGLLPVLFFALYLRSIAQRLKLIIDDTFKDVRLQDL
jgi:hypothetical protein